jgi:hypothetical protein
MKHFLNILFFILPICLNAQVLEDFSDGDFTSNPSWNGTNTDFIINSNQQLQTNATVAGTSYLSLSHGLTTLNGKEWKFYAKQSFAGSTSNFSKIYLTAVSSDLSANPDGFYILLGEALSTDAVRLFKSQGGVSTEICAGTAAAIATSANVGIRVVRSNVGNWSLYVDYTGGTNFVFQSSGTDATNLIGTFSGIVCTYTVSNATKFYYDTFYIGDEIIDTQTPTLVSANVISNTQVDLLFSEAIDQVSGETVSNYNFNPNNTATSATRDNTNLALIHLLLQNPLTNGMLNTVSINNVQDIAGNTSVLSGNFTLLQAETPIKGDVIITEFMADPSPTIGLPEIEYIEIHNKSAKIFNVGSWKIGDNSSEGTITDNWLLPGQYKVLVATSNLDSLPNTIAVTSFPSLNNAGDDIVLKDNSGIILDKITYTDLWYQDDLKKQGGYALELINLNDPCSDKSNWKASNATNGGTPAIQNSVYDAMPDTENPFISFIEAIAPNELHVLFSEGMDSVSIANATSNFSPTLTLLTTTIVGAFPTEITYTFQENLMGSFVYQFTIQPVADCWLNQTNLSGHFELPETILKGDIVINELLFNPVTGGYDYVELRNNSAKTVDLYQLEIANYDDSIANNKQINSHFLMKQGDLVVLTPDSTIQKQQYPFAIPGRFIQMTLPTFNNDSSTVYVINSGNVIDKVSYFEDWHFSLLDNFDGKSLEKIDPMGSSNASFNWHTAAESVGFGTPGRENSQYSLGNASGEISLSNETFSPDNDGFEDVIQLTYEMENSGMVGTLDIYDDRGRHVKNVTRNELLGKKGSISWNGLTETSQKASIGTYIFVFKSYDESGKIFEAKKTFVLAGKLN